MLDEMYQILNSDESVSGNVNRYMFNNFPDVKEITKGFITLNPLTSPSYSEFTDGTPIAQENTIRVDVFIKSSGFANKNPRIVCMETMQRVTDLLDAHDYKENSTFSPEYDKLNQIYRETKSFTKIYYRSDY